MTQSARSAFEIVREVVCLKAEAFSFDVSRIDEFTTYDDLCFDSSDRLDLMRRLEEEFGVELSDRRQREARFLESSNNVLGMASVFLCHPDFEME